MPTNVTPEYKKAKAEFQKAQEPAERLRCLKEMLRTLPKHKGTEHLQADIKTRIKELTEELSASKKGKARTGPVYALRQEGAAQVALIGPPNSGKSSLHRRLTGSQAEVGPYPYSTHAPLPGMLPYEDIHFQLVDLPPISTSFMESWMPNALQPAHAALLVVDLTSHSCVENIAAVRDRLEAKRISLVEEWGDRLPKGYLEESGSMKSVIQETGSKREEDPEDLEDPFHIRLSTLLVANKSDLLPDPAEIEVLEELLGTRYPAIAVSTKTGQKLDRIGPLLFEGLGVVRVYTKLPGHPADTNRPYTVFQGDTVYDVARLVHRELAESLKFARIWGSAKFDGQQVGRDHPVRDRDVVELHS